RKPDHPRPRRRRARVLAAGPPPAGSRRAAHGRYHQPALLSAALAARRDPSRHRRRRPASPVFPLQRGELRPRVARPPPASRSSAPMKARVVVIGAGPAGLTAARELARHGLSPVVLEQGRIVGGLARTETYRGFHFDMGGHRFFTKVDEIQKLWREMLGE